MCFLMAKQLNMLTPNKEVVTLKFMGDPHHFINVQKVEFRLAFKGISLRSGVLSLHSGVDVA